MSVELEMVRPDGHADGRGFALRRMFHAHIRTPDLGYVERWFDEVFGRPSVRLDAMIGSSPDLLNPTAHSTYTRVADLLIGSLDPGRFLRSGTPFYPVADRPRLSAFGWNVDGIDELYNWLQDLGYPILDDENILVDGVAPPTARGSDVPMFWLEPEIAGLRYQFLPTMTFPTHPLLSMEQEASAAAEDPLGIVRCSHHTVLTAEPKRAVRLFADVLGGTVIHEGRDEVRGLDSVYVLLADAVFEFAVPDRGTPAHADLPPGIPRDTYHAVTFEVRDLDRAARHLSEQGVRLQSRTEHCLVTEPRTSLGVPWGFVAAAVPGDDRAAAH